MNGEAREEEAESAEKVKLVVALVSPSLPTSGLLGKILFHLAFH